MSGTDPGHARFVPPRSAGPSRALGLLFSLILLGLAVVLVHDALVGAGALRTGWIASTAQAVGTVRPTTAVAVIGGVVLLLGLVLVVAALTPTRAVGRPLAGDGGLYLRDDDVARLASETARSVPGVLEAVTTATRRRVTVTIRTTGADETAAQVAERVTVRLGVLAQPPAVATRTRGGRR